MNVAEILESYSAWLDANHPVTALQSWPTVTLTAHGMSARNGEVNRRHRASQINALKRGIERLPLTDTDGRALSVKLTLIHKSYSETYGFMHASYFSYSVSRKVR